MRSRCPCDTVRLVFSRVTSGEAAFGVVPLENSQAGSVNETYELLLHTNLLRIVGEALVRVDHALARPAGRRAWRRSAARTPTGRRSPNARSSSRRCGSSRFRCTTRPGAARMVAESGERRGRGDRERRGRRASSGWPSSPSGSRSEKENFTKFAVIGTGDPGLGTERQDVARDGGPRRAGLAARGAPAVRGTRDQPAQARVAARGVASRSST